MTFRGRNAIFITYIRVLCPETESKDKMTMKSKTERINCDNVKAASAVLVRMHLCRFSADDIAELTGLTADEIARL